MGKIALLVAREDMIYQAHNILQEKKFEIHEMRVIKTENTVSEARHSIADGASVIIARGLQASLIKQYTAIPVVEIVMTAQEMALLVMKARQIVKKARPVIAVVGFKNMFCDMSYFDELYGIELRTYYAKQGNELGEAADRAVSDGVDLIIGGDTAVGAATAAGVPSLFLSMTEDSMRQAFAMAESIEFAMNAERKTAARMETLLDSSFSGVIQIDSDGVITSVNPLMEDIIGKSEDTLRGLPIGELAPVLGGDTLNRVLKDGREYSLFMEWNKYPFFAVIAPVIYELRIEGAIITCHRASRNQSLSFEAQQGKLGNADGKQGNGRAGGASNGIGSMGGGYEYLSFEDMICKASAMKECVRVAGLYAFSEQPVMLVGETGTEHEDIAECIHSAGIRKEAVFRKFYCKGCDAKEQTESLFGSRGLVMQCKGGSLFIRDIEMLSRDNQYRLFQLISSKLCPGGVANSAIGDGGARANVRIIASSEKCLSELVQSGSIIKELYYILSGLELRIPPLRERREDLKLLIEEKIKDCCMRCGHYHVLTAGAMEMLMRYTWNGNRLQVESFCERLILMATKRSIDEITVRELLEELYPGKQEHMDSAEYPDFTEHMNFSGGINFTGKPSYAAAQDFTTPIAPREADKIREKLILCGGSREEAARELGISKSTLWRKMKKYGIR